MEEFESKQITNIDLSDIEQALENKNQQDRYEFYDKSQQKTKLTINPNKKQQDEQEFNQYSYDELSVDSSKMRQEVLDNHNRIKKMREQLNEQGMRQNSIKTNDDLSAQSGSILIQKAKFQGSDMIITRNVNGEEIEEVISNQLRFRTPYDDSSGYQEFQNDNISQVKVSPSLISSIVNYSKTSFTNSKKNQLANKHNTTQQNNFKTSTKQSFLESRRMRISDIQNRFNSNYNDQRDKFRLTDDSDEDPEEDILNIWDIVKQENKSQTLEISKQKENQLQEEEELVDETLNELIERSVQNIIKEIHDPVEGVNQVNDKTEIIKQIKTDQFVTPASQPKTDRSTISKSNLVEQIPRTESQMVGIVQAQQQSNSEKVILVDTERIREEIKYKEQLMKQMNMCFTKTGKRHTQQKVRYLYQQTKQKISIEFIIYLQTVSKEDLEKVRIIQRQIKKFLKNKQIIQSQTLQLKNFNVWVVSNFHYTFYSLVKFISLANYQ